MRTARPAIWRRPNIPSFVYAAVLGWLVFGERVSPWTLGGAAIIVAACLYRGAARDIAAHARKRQAVP